MALLTAFKQSTPPGSIINGPPTPPLTTDAKIASSVAAILRVFERYKNGYPPSVPWTVYRLNSKEHEDLQRRLKDDEELWGYVDDRVKYDYDPIGSKLIIRMTTTLHDTFASELVAEIKKGFEDLKMNQVKTRAFIDKISSVSGAIHFEEDGQKFKHMPDIRFHHKDAAWPGVVIEVSYSQKRKSLIDLHRTVESDISIWRLKTSPGPDRQPEGEVVQELDNELFRDAEGNPILSSSGLELPLDNFAVQALSKGLPDRSVIVGPETLCTLLAEAEKWNDKSVLLEGVKPARIKRKYRQRTGFTSAVAHKALPPYLTWRSDGD